MARYFDRPWFIWESFKKVKVKVSKRKAKAFCEKSSLFSLNKDGQPTLGKLWFVYYVPELDILVEATSSIATTYSRPNKKLKRFDDYKCIYIGQM